MKKIDFICKTAFLCLVLAGAQVGRSQNLLPEIFGHIQEGDFMTADYKMSMVDTTKLSLSKRRQDLLYHYCRAALQFEDHDLPSARKSIRRALEYRANLRKRPTGVSRKDFRKLPRAIDALSVKILRQMEQVETKKEVAIQPGLSTPASIPADKQVNNKDLFDSMRSSLQQRYEAFMKTFSIEMMSDSLVKITCQGDSIQPMLLDEMAAVCGALIENYAEKTSFQIARLGVTGIGVKDKAFNSYIYDGRNGCINRIECQINDERELVSVPVGSQLTYTDWFLLQLLNVRQRFELSFSEPPMLISSLISLSEHSPEEQIQILIFLTKKSQ